MFKKDSFDMNSNAQSQFENCGKWEEVAQKYYNIDPIKLLENQRNVTYGLFYREFERIYGHYFRALYRILQFLKSNELLDSTRNRTDSFDVAMRYLEYCNFISSQMSTDELSLLYYNTLLFPDMIETLTHYKFFASLNLDELISKEDQSFYQ